MAVNTNTGQDQAVTVFGNPESFKRLIKNHGQLGKVKQALPCPCNAGNSGTPDMYCDLCNGDGYIFRYQKRFLVSDENSKSCGSDIYPYMQPVITVKKVETVTADFECGIVEHEVRSFNSTTITLKEEISPHVKKRVSYYFDGRTLVEKDLLDVDVANGIMYAPGAVFDAGYQSSNPLNAYADITEIVRLYNFVTETDIIDYTFDGNVIKTTEPIVAGEMKADYYYSDLTYIITNDIKNKDNLESWTNDISSGECRMAFLPWWDLAKGDIIVLSACVLYTRETLTHNEELDRLFEIEIFDLNDVILDSAGNVYDIDTDYILQGRFIKWIGNSPEIGSVISIRYGYKPSYVIFEDNPEPNNLENKQYPKIIYAKSYSKIGKDELTKLVSGSS